MATNHCLACDGFGARADRAYLAVAEEARRAARRGRTQDALRLVQAAARIAAFAHGGRFADGRVENLALDIGRGLEPGATRTRTSAVARDTSRMANDATRTRRVLHVATRLLPTGGHTRLLTRLIELDTSSEHHIALTDQGALPIPPEVRGATIHRVDDAPRLTERALALRHLAARTADVVLLYVDQFDVVPVVAFADGALPVGFVNHADHTFWLGSSVTDLLINVRGFAEEVSSRRRFPAATFMLPLPLNVPPTTTTRAAARAASGLRDDDVALLSMGSAYKYIPSPTHDFFATTAELLANAPRARLFLVGVTEAQAARYLPAGIPDRLHCLGVVADPTDLELAADLFIEGFPYGSLTAMLEAALLGAYPLTMYAPIPQTRLSDDPGLIGTAHVCATREEYLIWAQRLIDDDGLRRRLAAETCESMRREHTGDEWLERLSAMYDALEQRTHAPRALPETDATHDSVDCDRCAFDRLELGALPLVPLGTIAGSAPPDPVLTTHLLRASLRARDTRLSLRHLRPWAATIWRAAARRRIW